MFAEAEHSVNAVTLFLGPTSLSTALFRHMLNDSG